MMISMTMTDDNTDDDNTDDGDDDVYDDEDYYNYQMRFKVNNNVHQKLISVHR